MDFCDKITEKDFAEEIAEGIPPKSRGRDSVEKSRKGVRSYGTMHNE